MATAITLALPLAALGTLLYSCMKVTVTSLVPRFEKAIRDKNIKGFKRLWVMQFCGFELCYFVLGFVCVLVGPFAGIGDSIYSGALRIIATGIALGFCQAGSWLGPILYALVFNIPNLLIRYLRAEYGLKLGNTYAAKALQSGAIKAFTKGFSVLGLNFIVPAGYGVCRFEGDFEMICSWTMAGTEGNKQEKEILSPRLG